MFTHRNETAEVLAARLKHHKVAVADLHIGYNKKVRKQAIAHFRGGKATVMIASDVAAHGLDIPGVTHVFNLDIRSKGKDCLHRVGHTRRAGIHGVAVSVPVRSEVRLVRQFEQDFSIIIREVFLREGQMLEVGDDTSVRTAVSESCLIVL